jgi:hypothetical protein
MLLKWESFPDERSKIYNNSTAYALDFTGARPFSTMSILIVF